MAAFPVIKKWMQQIQESSLSSIQRTKTFKKEEKKIPPLLLFQITGTSFPEASPGSFPPALLARTVLVKMVTRKESSPLGHRVTDQHQKCQWDGLPKGCGFLENLGMNTKNRVQFFRRD